MEYNGEESKYRPVELSRVLVTYRDERRVIMCFCGEEVSHSIIPHMKKCHREKWQAWLETFVILKNLGWSWKKIMRLFCASDGRLLFSWTVIEKYVKEEVELGRMDYVPAPHKRVKRWQPDNFSLETNTVWDFPRRGNWAVHSGDYRGNWPPQVPRNLILRYTQEGDTVVDAFAGGGTTLIEAWLLKRKSIGLDISRLAIQTMNAKLLEMERLEKVGTEFEADLNYRPLVINGNALELSSLMISNGIDSAKLICIHPPYMDSIKYTYEDANDLALSSEPEIFYRKVETLAREVKTVLSSDGICAVLVGDIRKDGKMIPIGFGVLNAFRGEGFELDTTVIKTQNRDSSSEFYVGKEPGILLMAHEYLFILRK